MAATVEAPLASTAATLGNDEPPDPDEPWDYRGPARKLGPISTLYTSVL